MAIPIWNRNHTPLPLETGRGFFCFATMKKEETTKNLSATASPIQEKRQAITVVKVGGAVVEDEAQLTELLQQFAAIEGPKVLVHGGGRRATKIAAQLGIESQMVGGRRITDAQMLDVVTMVYGGLVNKHIVARLQAIGINAVGLTGADIDIIRSHRRPPVPLSSFITAGVADSDTMIDFGFVGDVDRVDACRLSSLIDADVVPVVAPLSHDGNGSLLNTNADTIAAEVSKALAESYAVTLVFAFEKPGVLARPDDDDSVIPHITRSDFERYVADGTISGGMIPKVSNALQAIDAGVKRVVITRPIDIARSGGTIIAAF